MWRHLGQPTNLTINLNSIYPASLTYHPTDWKSFYSCGSMWCAIKNGWYHPGMHVNARGTNLDKPPRKTPSKGKASTSKSAPSTSASKPRRSKLAKENDITAEEETEIKEAWNLFRLDDVEEYEDEKEGVIRTTDVRNVLK